jgi:hypothetical protein
MPLATANGPPNPYESADGTVSPARHAGLSNLRVLPNLLTSDEYQDAIYSCTLDEILDLRRRMPTVFSRERLSREHRYEFVARGGPNLRPIPRLDADGRATRWVEAARLGLAAAVAALEERADLEDGFELLLLAREACYATEDGLLRAEAAAWDRRVCAVLLRPEFRLTPDMVEERLEGILGRPLANPNRPRVPEPAAEERRTPAPAAPPETHAQPPSAQPEPEILVAPESFGAVAEPPAVVAVPAPAPEVVALAPEHAEPKVAPPADDALATVVARWAGLPDHVKSCILMLIDAADRLRPAKE